MNRREQREPRKKEKEGALFFDFWASRDLGSVHCKVEEN